jgi:hypothetical protein
MGKSMDAKSNSSWGVVEIIVYPVGTGVPSDQQAGIHDAHQ